MYVYLERLFDSMIDSADCIGWVRIFHPGKCFEHPFPRLSFVDIKIQSCYIYSSTLHVLGIMQFACSNV
jgi:hypothetical protein